MDFVETAAYKSTNDMLEKRIVDSKTLEGLHGWFKHLCTYGNSDGEWMDRMYAEGQIFACREILNDFTTKFGEVSRGFEYKTEKYFLNGYTAFQREHIMGHKDELLVILFNKVYKQGDTIKLRDDSGEPFEAVVSHGAAILGGHTPVVYVEEKGSYALARLIID